MKYYMHRDYGTVLNLSGDETLESATDSPEKWTPVHFRKGAREPSPAAKVVGGVLVALFCLSIPAVAVALAVLAWKAVLS